MKKNKFLLIIMLLYIIVILFLLYPRELVRIIGNEPPISNDTSLSIIQRHNILESGNVVESLDKNACNEIYNYLNTFKYTRSNMSYKKLDGKETYVISMKNNDEEIFYAAIRGNSHVSIMDKNENWTLYKVIGEKIDLNYFENIFNSLNEN